MRNLEGCRDGFWGGVAVAAAFRAAGGNTVPAGNFGAIGLLVGQTMAPTVGVGLPWLVDFIRRPDPLGTDVTPST